MLLSEMIKQLVKDLEEQGDKEVEFCTSFRQEMGWLSGYSHGGKYIMDIGSQGE